MGHLHSIRSRRDMIFAEQSFSGARPVYRGLIGIDATWKQGYRFPFKWTIRSCASLTGVGMNTGNKLPEGPE